jgi:broad specificity phosphatase PhoE
MTEPTVTRWWWIRHAPVTDYGGKLYGQTDVPANTSDRERYEGLDRALPRGAVWLTSALQRTHQTASAIADAGHPVPEAAIERDLAEQSFGAWQGKTWDELSATRGDLAHKYWVAPAHHVPPEGESFVAVMDRVAPVVTRRTVQHAGTDSAPPSPSPSILTRSARSPSPSTISRSRGSIMSKATPAARHGASFP